MTITALYASLFALIFFALSVRVITVRHATRIGVGDGGDNLLKRRMRAQANCAEYGPLILILMGLSEHLTVSAWALHGLGIAFLAGRALHGFNIARDREVIRLRIFAMGLTFTALLGFSLLNLIQLARVWI
ncbi:MAPEG family protein [Aestuariispira insulae]|uniref:MAPEG family protein n=1 Tax=Aestuariispira insulae TaxID=1461337 RepID=A0A3D9H9F9_9PROT|nr:MAPEG family protein [Aestuariispira insulae]RED46130.1 hypothetical protein DFP90_11039 [Aestuariispira insulae]